VSSLSKEQVSELLKDTSLGYIDKAVFLNDIAQHYPSILEVKHICEILSVSNPTVRKLLKEARKTKVFPVAKTNEKKGGRYKVPRDPFLRYVFLGEVHPVGLHLLREQMQQEQLDTKRKKQKKEKEVN
jgi:hypothetical protein